MLLSLHFKGNLLYDWMNAPSKKIIFQPWKLHTQQCTFQSLQEWFYPRNPIAGTIWPVVQFLVPRIFNTENPAYGWHIYVTQWLCSLLKTIGIIQSEEASPINASVSFLLEIIVSSVTNLIFFGPYKYRYRVYQQTLLKRNTKFSTVQIRETYFLLAEDLPLGLWYNCTWFQNTNLLCTCCFFPVMSQSHYLILRAQCG